MRAYMSNRKDRYNATCGATSLRLPAAPVQAADEAARILAESEASYTGRYDTPSNHPTVRWLSEHGPVVETHIIDGRYIHGDATDHQSRFRDALAESLAAFVAMDEAEAFGQTGGGL